MQKTAYCIDNCTDNCTDNCRVNCADVDLEEFRQICQLQIDQVYIYSKVYNLLHIVTAHPFIKNVCTNPEI